MSFGFSQFYNLRNKQGRKISKARMRKTDQDIMNHSVLNSLALTQDCLSLLTENGLHPLHYSWVNSICDVAAIRQHRQRRNSGTYIVQEEIKFL